MIKFLKSAVVTVVMTSMILPGFGAQLAFAHDGTETEIGSSTEDHSQLPLINGDHRSDVAKCRLNDVEKIKQFRAEQKDKRKQIDSDAQTARKAAFDAFKLARKNATTDAEKKAAQQAFKDALKKLEQDRKTAITDLKGQQQPQKHDCVKPSDNGGDVKGIQDPPVNADKSCIKTYTNISLALNKQMVKIEKTYTNSVRDAENKYKDYLRTGVNKDHAQKVLQDNLTIAYSIRKADLQQSLENIGGENPNSFEDCIRSQNLSDAQSIKLCTKVVGDAYAYLIKVNGANAKAFALTHPTKEELVQFKNGSASELKELNAEKKSIPSICTMIVNSLNQP